MDFLGLAGIALGTTGVVALVLAIDAWMHTENSVPQQAWKAYAAWYKDPAEYLIDRRPVEKFAIDHAIQAALLLLIAIFVFNAHPVATR